METHMNSGPLAAYDLCAGQRWIAWHPATSVASARQAAQRAVAVGLADRYVLYNRSGLAVEEGPDLLEG